MNLEVILITEKCSKVSQNVTNDGKHHRKVYTCLNLVTAESISGKYCGKTILTPFIQLLNFFNITKQYICKLVDLSNVMAWHMGRCTNEQFI